MVNIFTAQNQQQTPQQQQKFKRQPQSHSDVGQDNGASLGRRIASTQPSALQEHNVDTLLMGISAHSLKKEKRQPPLEKATIRMKRTVKSEIKRMTRQWKVKGKSLSFSAVSAILLERAVQGHIDMQYGALLKPTIEKTIRDETRSQRLFLAVFLARLALDIGQTRNLVTNILGRHPDISDDAFKEILAESSKTAKRNIIRRTPQVAELIDIVEKWMENHPEESKASV